MIKLYALILEKLEKRIIKFGVSMKEKYSIQIWILDQNEKHELFGVLRTSHVSTKIFRKRNGVHQNTQTML
jgi:hypothetical protein